MSDILPPKRDETITSKGVMTLDFAQYIENISDVLSYFQIGDGDPTGSLVTNRKMIFLRQDGGAGTTLYINELGDGTFNGWRAI
ncbi:hypothetical protein KAR91_82400 [Candidatus Pacearchaeota archaeon]|nr:hypothetical protein [Candidatus Pacearchaeota archaeon]